MFMCDRKSSRRYGGKRGESSSTSLCQASEAAPGGSEGPAVLGEGEGGELLGFSASYESLEMYGM